MRNEDFQNGQILDERRHGQILVTSIQYQATSIQHLTALQVYQYLVSHRKRKSSSI